MTIPIKGFDVSLEGVDLKIDFLVHPPVSATHESDGCAPEVEIIRIHQNGMELSDSMLHTLGTSEEELLEMHRNEALELVGEVRG